MTEVKAQREASVSTHSRPKAAGAFIDQITFTRHVSTHSRPKAAGYSDSSDSLIPASFNTQPPEGGWFWRQQNKHGRNMFQHTAARRRLVIRTTIDKKQLWFQHTAARRRLV